MASPVPVARLRVLPPVPEKSTTSLSTEEAVLVEASPPTGGVAHVPSPRQKVDDEAEVPELRFVTGRLPVTPEARDTLVMVFEAPEIVLFVRVAVAAFFVASLVLSTLFRPTSSLMRVTSPVLAATLVTGATVFIFV